MNAIPRPAAGRDDSAPHWRVAVTVAVVLLTVHIVQAIAVAWRPTHARLDPAALRLRLDPNVATQAELELLPGIGPRLAERIIAYRSSSSQSPAFRTVEDLARVHRVGPATVELLRPLVHLPASAPDSESNP